VALPRRRSIPSNSEQRIRDCGSNYLVKWQARQVPLRSGMRLVALSNKNSPALLAGLALSSQASLFRHLLAR
jgi:hypothetical protein